MSSATITFPLLGLSFEFANSFTVFGFRIYWYGVIIALGFLLGALYALWRAKDIGLTQENILDMLICAAPAAIIFARLYYVLFYQWGGENKYFQDPIQILYIRDGGLAIYGGIIGAVLAVVIYAKVKKVSLGALLDVGGLGLLIGQAVGRWGNFANREAYGIETGVPWRMGLTLEGATIYVHPTFLYESVWNALGFVLLHLFSKKKKQRYSGQVFLLYMIWYGLGRFWIEGMRTDSLYLFGTGLRISQVLAALAVVVGAALNFWFLKRETGKLNEKEA